MWVQIAILVVSMILSYSASRKAANANKPKPGEASQPVVEDGKKVRKIYGTVWVDDSIVLGFKEIGTDAIRTKGGKK